MKPEPVRCPGAQHDQLERARHRLPGRCRTSMLAPDRLRAAAIACLVVAGAGAATQTAAAMWTTGVFGSGWAGVGKSSSVEDTESDSAKQNGARGKASGLLAPGVPVQLTANFPRTGPRNTTDATGATSDQPHWKVVRPRIAGGVACDSTTSIDPAEAGPSRGTAQGRATGGAPGGTRIVRATLYLSAQTPQQCRHVPLAIEVTLGTGKNAPNTRIAVSMSHDPRQWQVGTLEPTSVPGQDTVSLSWPLPRDATPGGRAWIEGADTPGPWTVRSTLTSCHGQVCSAALARNDSLPSRIRVAYVRSLVPVTDDPDTDSPEDGQDPAGPDDDADTADQQDDGADSTSPDSPSDSRSISGSGSGSQSVPPQSPGQDPPTGDDPSLRPDPPEPQDSPPSVPDTGEEQEPAPPLQAS